MSRYTVERDAHKWLEKLPPARAHHNREAQEGDRIERKRGAPSPRLESHRPGGRVLHRPQVTAWLTGPYRRVPRGERRLLVALLVGAAAVAVRIVWGLL